MFKIQNGVPLLAEDVSQSKKVSERREVVSSGSDDVESRSESGFEGEEADDGEVERSFRQRKKRHLKKSSDSKDHLTMVGDEGSSGGGENEGEELKDSSSASNSDDEGIGVKNGFGKGSPLVFDKSSSGSDDREENGSGAGFRREREDGWEKERSGSQRSVKRSSPCRKQGAGEDE